MRRYARLGIRGRLLASLLLASVVTLATVALAMVPLLESRLESDRLSDLRGLARTARPELRSLPESEELPGSPELTRIVDRIQDRTGGRVAIYDVAGNELADTAVPGRPDVITRGEVRQLQGKAQRDETATGTSHGVAYAVAGVRVRGTRLTLVIAKRLNDTRAAESVLRRGLLLAALIAVAVAVALAVLLSRSLLRRLTQLHADARALHEDGLAHEITVEGDDEVADVAAALEEMRGRLAEAEASRQAFVSTASHELRTPLGSLQATLELLRESSLAGKLDADAAVAHADRALRQTHRLTALASDLLELSRLESDAPVRHEPVELLELSKALAADVRPQLAERGLEVRGVPSVVLGDPAAIARILRILLDNARNHGAGTVRVDVVDAGLTVSDEGTGVEAAEREHVFVRFARGEAAAGVPGAGLGLAIGRGLARAMGGDLELGAGASFVLKLQPWDPSEDPTPG